MVSTSSSVHHHHGLDRMRGVLRELGLDRGGIGAVAPVAGHEVHLDTPARRHLPPQGGEMAGLDHQHLVARRERVDDRGLPGARPRGREDDDRPGRLEDFASAFENRLCQVGKGRAAVIDDRHVHGPEHAVRNGARAGNLKEMASLMRGHDFLRSPTRQLVTPILHSISAGSTKLLRSIFHRRSCFFSLMFRS
jgi:hypothetical protein